MDSQSSLQVNLAKQSHIQLLREIYLKGERYKTIDIVFHNAVSLRLLFLCVKYSWWSLEHQGRLQLEGFTDLSNNYGFNGNKLSRPKLNAALRMFYDTENISSSQISIDNNGLVIEKCNSSKVSGNVTFGIAWSGHVNDRKDLVECVKSIMTANHSNRQVEILIACPRDSFFNLGYDVRWIDVPNTDEGIDIGAKKNILYEMARYEIVSIIHTRLRVNDDFFNFLPADFDSFTPAIVANYNDRLLPYFDLVMVRNIDTFLDRSFLGRNHLNRFYYERRTHLFILAKYQFYIDGGCIVLNKKKLGTHGPWHRSLRWGEAEDVWLSRFLDLYGFVQDRIESIVAYSSTNKSRSLSNSDIFSKLKLSFYRLFWFL